MWAGKLRRGGRDFCCDRALVSRRQSRRRGEMMREGEGDRGQYGEAGGRQRRRARAATAASTRSEPAFLSVSAVAGLIGETRSTLYRSIARGDFPVAVVRINGRLRIPRRALERLVSGEEAGDGATSPASSATGEVVSATLPARSRSMCSAARRSSSSMPSV